MTNQTQFDDILIINKHQLDLELVNQAQTYYQVAEEYAEAVSRRDAAYEGIKQVDAELYFQLRTEMEAEGIKITEAMLGQKVLSHPDHLKAHANHNLLKLEADKLAALKDALNQRTYMLRDLVQLYSTGYFTETSVNGTTSASSDISYLNNRKNIVEKKPVVNVENRKLKRETKAVS